MHVPHASLIILSLNRLYHCSLILASYIQLTGKKSVMGFIFFFFGLYFECQNPHNKFVVQKPSHNTSGLGQLAVCIFYLSIFLYATIKLRHKLPFP